MDPERFWNRAVMALVGPAADRRLRQLYFGDESRVACHEAAHVIADVALRRRVPYSVSIVPQDGSAGRVLESVEAVASGRSDRQQAAIAVVFGESGLSWREIRAHVRRAQSEADAFVGEWWPLIIRLGRVIFERKHLTRAEIVQTLRDMRHEVRADGGHWVGLCTDTPDLD